LKQQIKQTETARDIREKDSDFNREMNELARTLFKIRPEKRSQAITWLADTYRKAAGKDFLIAHSPGGWGNTPWDGLLEWEKSIVTGVTVTLEKLGYSHYVTQYFRSGMKSFGHFKDIYRDIRFFLTGRSGRAEALAAMLQLLAKHLPDTMIILVGASQGAAFNNATVKNVPDMPHLFSIELGTFFPYMKHRVIMERTLAIDNNGIMRDPMCERNLWAGTKSYLGAPYRWLKLRLQGRPIKFTHCINTPGHEYAWEYPGVHTNIEKFLKEKFGSNL